MTTFINEMNGLARRLDAAVLMLGHPPKNGAEYSRQHRLALGGPVHVDPSRAVEKDEEGEPSDVMVLARTKANYAPGGEESGCGGSTACCAAMTAMCPCQRWMPASVGTTPRWRSWPPWTS